MPRDAHYLRSAEREEYLEYIFLGRLCSHAWKMEQFVEVARSHTDAFGYDLILKANGVLRHVQLKASVDGGSTAEQKVSLRLAEQPSGCVVWMSVADDALEIARYGWFGGKPGAPLPDLGVRVGKHTKGDATGTKKERSATRVLTKGRFEWIETTQELFERLFGHE
ncbi:hypothetical protein PVW48_01375 [Dinoroseobacter sp. PD6]|nr:hypothetical protein [Dinoroseobacter sp. PD6]MDD9715380.1 hypothetical protein [Dinoroseobacter sp. PD6]